MISPFGPRRSPRMVRATRTGGGATDISSMERRAVGEQGRTFQSFGDRPSPVVQADTDFAPNSDEVDAILLVSRNATRAAMRTATTIQKAKAPYPIFPAPVVAASAANWDPCAFFLSGSRRSAIPCCCSRCGTAKEGAGSASPSNTVGPIGLLMDMFASKSGCL
jgi:hypothetical protein